ncbi:restriction endonuclease subunit S [Bacillus pacificus]|uniref:restriction endonuclease subunit S n=1 Tax=Bacillus pacificus TaxID=2026187 RepID=UPI00069AEB6E|nr:restriction endonuclease subunit S [Bacillus pacificus]HDR7347500.1 restriction endonuclease subunit S [Bacillus toyonensis]
MSKNVPKVRFDGFSSDWMEKELSEISTRITKGTTPADKSWEGTIKYIKTDSINSINGNIESTSRISKKEHESNLKRSKLEVNDILFSIVGTLGRVGIVKEKDLPANTNQQICIIRLNEGDINFIFTALRTPLIEKFIKSDATIGAQPSISLWQMEALKVPFPQIDEQQKIGTFFKHLDDTIALQQQLVEQQQQYKKAMLQKMFPQKGERVPKVRFYGFSEKWEERRAENIFKSISDKNHEELPVLSATQDKGMVYRDEVGIDIKFDEKSKKTYKRVIPNQFVIHLRSFQGGFAFSDKEGITSPAYTILDFKTKNQNNPIFWKETLRSQSFIKRLETVTYGIRDGRSISYSDFLTLKFLVPSLEEQQKIGTFFEQIDDTIILHQKKLKDYQQLKKALLQRMFV